MAENEEETQSEDFPSNSNASKMVKREPREARIQRDDIPEKKKVRRIVKGKVYRKKKGWLDNLSSNFLGEETGNVGHYIVWDVLIPAAKATIQEMVSSGIEMLLFGETRGARRRSDRERTTVSYGKYFRSTSRNENPYERRSSRAVTRHGVEELYFENGDEATDVLDMLIHQAREYGMATVADYYDMAGADGNYTDEKWGWSERDLEGVRCRWTRGGYIIDLPRPVEIE